MGARGFPAYLNSNLTDSRLPSRALLAGSGIVEDLSETCVTTEFTSGDFRPDFEAFSRMIPWSARKLSFPSRFVQ